MRRGHLGCSTTSPAPIELGSVMIWRSVTLPSLLLLLLCLVATAIAQNSLWDNKSRRETETNSTSSSKAQSKSKIEKTSSSHNQTSTWTKTKVIHRTRLQMCHVPLLTCPKFTYTLFLQDNYGCPAPACHHCATDSIDQPECRGFVCPPAQEPICQKDTFLTNGRDSRGCPVLLCARCSGDSTIDRPGCGAELTCPSMATPLCAVGYYVRKFTNRNNCPAAECARCTNANQDQVGCPVVCPEVDMPNCPAGEFVQYSKNDNGCATAICAVCTSPTQPGCEKVSCPQIDLPRCKSGNYVEYGQDKNGCDFATCATCTKDTENQAGCRATCPEINVPSCKSDEYVQVGNTDDGCPAASCATCTEETSDLAGCKGTTTDCPQMSLPRCAHMSYLKFGRDSQGCPTFTCAACTDKTVGQRGCSRCPQVQEPVCPKGYYVRNSRMENDCTVSTCAACTEDSRDEAGCESPCPQIQIPRCLPGYYLRHQWLPNGCPAATCATCTQDTSDKKGCQQTECPEINIPRCPPGEFVEYGKDENVCDFATCARCTDATANEPECQKPQCPQVQPPRCQSGEFVEYRRSEQGCEFATCARCTNATANEPGCSDTAGCTETNKPDCPGKIARDVRIGNTCHWVCIPRNCGNRQPQVCKAGEYRADSIDDPCVPWVCRRCDFHSRMNEACRPKRNCKSLDWSVQCPAGQYRSVQVSETSDCLKVSCISCDQVSPQPKECSRKCPVPMVHCPPGQVLKLRTGQDGCELASCRVCEGDECEQSRCQHKGMIPQQESDCAENFYLGTQELDGCLARVCLPCNSELANKHQRCSKVPRSCPPAHMNCQHGQQRAEQVIDDQGCPKLQCFPCQQVERCESNERRRPIPTKWQHCPRFTCLGGRVGHIFEGRCPKLDWRPSPIQFGSESVTVGNCSLNRFVTCPQPTVNCREGQLPRVVGNCSYECQDYGTNKVGKCFPGENYVMFLVDIGRSKSLFQIKFQVASFIAKFASQVSKFGTQGSQFGAIMYSSKVLYTINPDSCVDATSFFNRFMQFSYDADDGTATGDAALECGRVLQTLERKQAKKTVVVITNSVTTTGASVSRAAEVLHNVDRYFISLTSEWSTKARAEALQFATSQNHVLQLPSYHLLATSGVMQLFPKCHSDCSGAEMKLQMYTDYMDFLKASLISYEEMVQLERTSLAEVYERLDTTQSKYEKKQVHLEFCIRMLEHYRRTQRQLENKLTSISQVTKNSGMKEHNFTSEELKQLQNRLTRLEEEKSTLHAKTLKVETEVQEIRTRITELKEEYNQKITVVKSDIAKYEKLIRERWESLKQLMEEIITWQRTYKEVQSILSEKKQRIQILISQNEQIRKSTNFYRVTIKELKQKNGSTHVQGLLDIQKQLSDCQQEARKEGFVQIVQWQSGSSVKVQEVLKALTGEQREQQFTWMSEESSEEYQQFTSLRNFTVGTYSRVKLVLRDAAGKLKAFLTFKTEEANLLTFFSPRNLIGSFPWRVEALKELSDFNWNLISSRYSGLAFTAAASTESNQGDQCSQRRCLLTMVTQQDPCNQVKGPYPRFLASLSSSSAMQLLELEEVTTVELTGRPIALRSSWLPGLVASMEMPLGLKELLENRLLAFPLDAAPRKLTNSIFYKSHLLTNPNILRRRLNLVLADGTSEQLTFSSAIGRETITNATWSKQQLEQATEQVWQWPGKLLIGSADPCTNQQGSGFVFITTNPAQCPAVSDQSASWAALVSTSSSRATKWSSAARVTHLEIMLERPQVLPTLQ